MRVFGSRAAVLEHERGYLRSMPNEEKRREPNYQLNDWRGLGTMIAMVTGTGVKKMRDDAMRFGGRQSIRVAILCRFLG